MVFLGHFWPIEIFEPKEMKAQVLFHSKDSTRLEWWCIHTKYMKSDHQILMKSQKYWPRRDSNPQSSDPKSDAISIRPRGRHSPPPLESSGIKLIKFLTRPWSPSKNLMTWSSSVKSWRLNWRREVLRRSRENKLEELIRIVLVV